MGTNTGFAVSTVYLSGHGNDRYGVCEICKKQMSEAAVFDTHKIYKHADGFLYLAGGYGRMFAHMDCGLHEGARVISKRTLKYHGKLKVLPYNVLRDNLIAAGFSEASSDAIVESIKNDRTC